MDKCKIPLVSLSKRDLNSTGAFKLIVQLNELEAALGKPLEVDDTIKIDVADCAGTALTTGEFPITASHIKGGYRMLETSFANLPTVIGGTYSAQLSHKRKGGAAFAAVEKPLPIVVPDGCCDHTEPLQVQLRPTSFTPTPTTDLWDAIKGVDLDFNQMQAFVDGVLCTTTNTTVNGTNLTITQDVRDFFKNRLPYVNVDEYSLVVFAIDAYVRAALKIDRAGTYFGPGNTLPYFKHLADLDQIACDYVQNGCGPNSTGVALGDCSIRYTERSGGFFAMELWYTTIYELGLLYQAWGALELRFQNLRGLNEVEPLMRFDTSPLRPLSNLIWGKIQNQQHDTSIARRNNEHQHAYGVVLRGRAVPPGMGVDNRSMFLATFHNMLSQASLFYNNLDDNTRQADPFPLLTAIRDVHLELANGNHNAYQNMTYTTRIEVLTMQYLLAKPEMRLFLGGRQMVPYPKPFMGCLEMMKSIQGWDPVSVLHIDDLASCGERLLLSCRYGDWTTTNFNIADAGNWAVAFRNDVSKYINAFRAITGVDLSADAVRINPEERGAQIIDLMSRRMRQSGIGGPRMQQGVPLRSGAMRSSLSPNFQTL